MKQEEIISLLDEAIKVLEAVKERKLSGKQRNIFRNIRSLCLDLNRRDVLLGSRSMDFATRVGCACEETLKRRTMSDAMMILAHTGFFQSDRRKLDIFLRRLRQKISMEELRSTDEFLRLANAGLYSEPFVRLNLSL